MKNHISKSDYIAVIKIPKINLEKGLYDVNDINNNVDKNIQILKSSIESSSVDAFF